MNLNGNFLTIYFYVVQELHGVLGFLGTPELDQGISFGPLRNVVPGNLNVINGSDVLKIFANVRFINILHLLVINKSLDTYLTIALLLRSHGSIALTGCIEGPCPRHLPVAVAHLLLLLLLLLLSQLPLDLVGLGQPVLLSL